MNDVSARKPKLLRILRILVLVCALPLFLLWYFHAGDYTSYFSRKRGTLGSVVVTPAGIDSLYERSWVSIENVDGFRVDCGMLVPNQKTGKGRDVRRYPVIVLLGGKATGKHAIDYAVDIRDVIIIAPDYPYTPRESYSFWQFIADVPEIRGALLDMVPSVILLTDYLWQRADVDTERVVMLGYSFGAPLVPVIIANDRRSAAAAVVYGGGDLQSLIAHNVRRYEGLLMGEAVGLLGGLLLRPLEPLRYIEEVSPCPLIMINGSHDELIPRRNAEQLYNAAHEPKKIIWLESRHVNPRDVELTRAIVAALTGELRAIGILEGPAPNGLRSHSGR
jgi:predicted esterase